MERESRMDKASTSNSIIGICKRSVIALFTDNHRGDVSKPMSK